MHLAMTGCFQPRILRIYVKKMNEIYGSHKGQVYKDSYLQQRGKKRASQHQLGCCLLGREMGYGRPVLWLPFCFPLV